jgi:transcriptional regulator with XRE-family HTH domain
MESIDIGSWSWRAVRAGLSVNELARAVGKTPQQVSVWLNKKVEPKYHTVLAIESVIRQAEKKAGIE